MPVPARLRYRSGSLPPRPGIPIQSCYTPVSFIQIVILIVKSLPDLSRPGLLAIAVSLSLLAGCGQKGPLFLPKPQPDKTATPPAIPAPASPATATPSDTPASR
ncbi:LPS translocon maturation chaperone LptM [Noviherbaspirillum massiliense]|uniref:LPS translocon maturation chaperone LptM n=1 Tax=Noviherbaspirillum massiliense TaxID=1465823 RepID=UPI0009D99BC4|nr:lipoprotein [Noviherbaspirillum massiliense]